MDPKDEKDQKKPYQGFGELEEISLEIDVDRMTINAILPFAPAS